MKSITQNDKKKPQRLPASAMQPLRPKSIPDWKPEPCGLSRKELREIVAEILG